MQRSEKFLWARNAFVILSAAALVVTYFLLQFHPERHARGGMAGLAVFLFAALAAIVLDGFHYRMLIDRKFDEKKNALDNKRVALEREYKERNRNHRSFIS